MILTLYIHIITETESFKRILSNILANTKELFCLQHTSAFIIVVCLMLTWCLITTIVMMKTSSYSSYDGLSGLPTYYYCREYLQEPLLKLGL